MVANTLLPFRVAGPLSPVGVGPGNFQKIKPALFINFVADLEPIVVPCLLFLTHGSNLVKLPQYFRIIFLLFFEYNYHPLCSFHGLRNPWYFCSELLPNEAAAGIACSLGTITRSNGRTITDNISNEWGNHNLLEQRPTSQLTLPGIFHKLWAGLSLLSICQDCSWTRSWALLGQCNHLQIFYVV